MKDFDENKIKYLEMIQSVVSRMASNCFILKGWMITLVAGIFVVTFENGKLLVLLIYIPIFSFWLLDSYYLQQERKYRKLYEYALTVLPSKIDFDLRPFKSDKDSKTNFLQCVFSFTELWFYLPTILVATVIILKFIVC